MKPWFAPLMRGVVTLAVLLVSPGRRVYGLDPERAVTQYVVDTWRSPQALPNDDVTSVVQTRDGYLWVGTVEGLARFDGVRSVVFNKTNTPAIANNWVRALLEDRSGRLWIGTFGGGLVCLQGGRFIRYGARQGIAQDVILSLYEDREGRVWAGTHGAGFYRLQGGAFAREPGTEAADRISVRAFLEDRAGTFWIGAEDGLYRIDRGRMTHLTRTDGLTDDHVLALAEDDGGLWIGTEKGGLDRLSAGRITAITVKEGLSHDRVWCLGHDRDGNLWIGTDGGGLNRLSRGRLSSLTTKNGLTNDFVWAIHEDREGSLWIGTNGGGLVQLKSGPIIPLTRREGLPSDFIWAVRRTSDGSLWIGTEDAGLVRLHSGLVTTFTTRDGLASNRVKCLLERRDGSLWIGTELGLDVWRDEKLRHAEVPGLENTTVNALAEDRDSVLWIGTNSAGLMRLKDGRVKVFSIAEGLSDASVSFALAARDGSLWVSTVGGIDRLIGGRIVQSFGKRNGLPSDYATSLYEDPDGTIWAGTRGGLVRIRGDRIERITSLQGLPDDAVMLAIPDEGGSIWIGGNQGLFRVSRRELDETLAGRQPTIHPTTFGLEEGMRSLEVNGCGSSVWRDADGRLWFATRGGLASILPSRIGRNRLAPPVAIEEVIADGRTLAAPGPWRLSAGTRHLVFHYTALSLRVPSRVRIEHRLDGFDTGWLDSGSSRSAEYTNLPHGRYSFRVIAENEDGVWNQAGARVAFEIEPRFYETLWFRALVVLIFAVFGPLFFAARVRRLRRQKVELEGLVAARTAELADMVSRLEELASTDKLTGTWNRRYLETVAPREISRANRERIPISAMILDIDHFKEINDNYGHQGGDRVLVELCLAIRTELRTPDVLARLGGDEFIVLLPKTNLAAAVILAGRLRKAAIRQVDPKGPWVRISVGVAEWLPSETFEDWFVRVDSALYAAKRTGRDRVLWYPDVPHPEDADIPGPWAQFRWDEAYEFGVPTVDAKHRELLLHANGLIAALATEGEGSEIDVRFNALREHLLIHFATEEEILANCRHPKLNEHRTKHQHLLQMVLTLAEEVRAGATRPDRILWFLANDLIAQHLLTVDRECFTDLGMSGEPAS